MPGPSRRAFLLGGAGLALAGGLTGLELVRNGTLPGKYALARLDGACGSATPPPPGPLPRRHAVSFDSAYRGRRVQMVTLLPSAASAASGLPVVIALHGSGSDATAMADQIAPAMTAARVRQLGVICVDGGDTYWHKRADGDDPVGMIVHEVLPMAAAGGLRTTRIGITGLSMGGYGALLLAERLGGAPGTGGLTAAAAVAALSPAVFASYGDARAASRTSFDSPSDFGRNDVRAGLDALRQVPAWIACGSDDPFQPEISQLLARLPAVTGHPVPGGIMSGCHDDAFWGRNMPAALRFISTRLT